MTDFELQAYPHAPIDLINALKEHRQLIIDFLASSYGKLETTETNKNTNVTPKHTNHHIVSVKIVHSHEHRVASFITNSHEPYEEAI